MNADLPDDDLLELLRASFSSAPQLPDDVARQRLLSALSHDNMVDFAVAPTRSRRGRLLGSRASAVTMSALFVLSLGGVAAAAVATNTLPGPTRALAYDLGLPVTSPALVQARQQLNDVRTAAKRHESKVARTLAKGLISDLRDLNHGDLEQIRTPAKQTLGQLGLLAPVSSILGDSSASSSSDDSSPSTTSPTTSEGSDSSPSTTLPVSPSTTTTTSPDEIIPTVPSVGSIIGSTGVGDGGSDTTTTQDPLLPSE